MNESLDKENIYMADWRYLEMKNMPQQSYGSDYSVFLCIFAGCIGICQDLNFSKGDMPYFRNIIL